MKSLIIILLAITMTATPMHKAIVTKIHEDDQITVLVNYDGKVKETKVHGYDFNIPIKLSEEIPTQVVQGKFSEGYTEPNGNTYYQFKSNDNLVWWALTEKEIGFKPSTEKEYVLLYCDNGTTADNKPCEDSPELGCECEVYDDIFFGIFESN